ncbi:MAG: DNA-processing protein DprA [Candidatus Paceibacterota bacterium]
MDYPIQKLDSAAFPPLLNEIPEPPASLNFRGTLPTSDMKLLAVVGSRNYSTYGKQVVEYLIDGLRGYNIGIVSGLALGIDSLAHRAALASNLYTLAIPGGGLDDSVIYPRAHTRLAHEILAAGGGLLSEFDPTFKATAWSFPQRNRIVTGISSATLIIEATERSGTLISARLATDYNRELMVVPGNIFSQNTAGCHQFLKLGAIPVTTPEDILETLQIAVDAPKAENATPKTLTAEEQAAMELLREPTDRDALIRALDIPTHEASTLLMKMEMDGHIIEENGIIRRT